MAVQSSERATPPWVAAANSTTRCWNCPVSGCSMADDGDELPVGVERNRRAAGCPSCGVIVRTKDLLRVLMESVGVNRRARLLWSKRHSCCPDQDCHGSLPQGCRRSSAPRKKRGRDGSRRPRPCAQRRHPPGGPAKRPACLPVQQTLVQPSCPSTMTPSMSHRSSQD